MDAPQPDGLSLFQHRCLSALRSAVRIEEPTREGESEVYVTGSVSQSPLRFWIYADGAQASGSGGEVMLERWDYRTPNDLIEQFIAFVVAAASSNKAVPADAAKGPPRG